VHRAIYMLCRRPTNGEKNDCPPNPYMIVHHMSAFSDHQTLKLQEAPDMVPVGELPRHILLSVDRWVVQSIFDVDWACLMS
jgi:DNA replication licensing factor MCM5